MAAVDKVSPDTIQQGKVFCSKCCHYFLDVDLTGKLRSNSPYLCLARNWDETVLYLALRVCMDIMPSDEAVASVVSWMKELPVSKQKCSVHCMVQTAFVKWGLAPWQGQHVPLPSKLVKSTKGTCLRYGLEVSSKALSTKSIKDCAGYHDFVFYKQGVDSGSSNFSTCTSINEELGHVENLFSSKKRCDEHGVCLVVHHATKGAGINNHLFRMGQAIWRWTVWEALISQVVHLIVTKPMFASPPADWKAQFARNQTILRHTAFRYHNPDSDELSFLKSHEDFLAALSKLDDLKPGGESDKTTKLICHSMTLLKWLGHCDWNGTELLVYVWDHVEGKVLEFFDAADVNHQVRVAICFIFFCEKAQSPTSTKWLSEWDASAWWSQGAYIFKLIPRAWLIQWPLSEASKVKVAKMSSNNGGLPVLDVLTDDDSRMAICNETTGKRTQSISVFMSLPGIFQTLMANTVYSRALARVGIEIMKSDVPTTLRQSPKHITSRSDLARVRKVTKRKAKGTKAAAAKKTRVATHRLKKKTKPFVVVRRSIKPPTVQEQVAHHTETPTPNTTTPNTNTPTPTRKNMLLEFAHGPLLAETSLLLRGCAIGTESTIVVDGQEIDLLGLGKWEPTAKQIQDGLIPPHGTKAAARGFACGFSAGWYFKFHCYYKSDHWPLYKSVPYPHRGIPGDDAAIENYCTTGWSCCKGRYFGEKVVALHDKDVFKDPQKRTSFKEGLEASCTCGNTTANVQEEQIHSLMKQVCDARLSRSKDVGPAMASGHCDLMLKHHPSRREDLIRMKSENIFEASKAIGEVEKILSAEKGKQAKEQNITEKRVRKIAHILYVNDKLQEEVVPGEMMFKHEDFDRRQAHFKNWNSLPDPQKDLFIRQKTATLLAGELGAAVEQLVAEAELTEPQGVKHGFSFSNELYPVDTELFHSFMDPLAEAQRRALKDEQGRVGKVGVLRKMFEQELDAPADQSVASNSVLPDKKDIYNRKHVKKARKAAQTCGEVHFGFCRLGHSHLASEVGMFTASLRKYLKKRQIHKAPGGTQMLKFHTVGGVLAGMPKKDRTFMLGHHLLNPSVQVLQEWAIESGRSLRLPTKLSLAENNAGAMVEYTVWELAVEIFQQAHVQHSKLVRCQIDQLVYKDTDDDGVIEAIAVRAPLGVKPWSLLEPNGGAGAQSHVTRTQKKKTPEIAELQALSKSKKQHTKKHQTKKQHLLELQDDDPLIKLLHTKDQVPKVASVDDVDCDSSSESDDSSGDANSAGSSSTSDSDDNKITKHGKALEADEKEEKQGCADDFDLQELKPMVGSHYPLKFDPKFEEQLQKWELTVDCDAKGLVTMKQTGEKVGFVSEWKDGVSLSVKCKKHGCSHMIEQEPGFPMYSRIKAWMAAWNEGAVCYEQRDHERLWAKLFPPKPKKPKAGAKPKPKGKSKAKAAPKCTPAKISKDID